MFQWSSEFFSFQIFQQKGLKPTKLAKKITHFTIQFHSKNLTHLTNLNSLGVENNMLLQYSQKPFWLKIFPANMFLFGVRKNICTAPVLDDQGPHSSSSLKAIVCIFLVVKLYLVGGGGWVTQNDFLRWLAVQASKNILQFVILIEIFRNSAIFQHFNTPI